MKRAKAKDKTRHHKKRAFLAAFALCGNVSQAVLAAKVSRCMHYAWLKDDPQYVKDFAQAEADATDMLEAEARRRALNGVNEPVVYQGQLQGTWVDGEGNTVSQETPGARMIPLTIRKYSDTLLIFLLKGARPNKYRDNAKVEHTGPDGAPLIPSKVTHSFDHDGYREMFRHLRGQTSADGADAATANRN